MCVYWMRGCGGVNNTSENIRAVQSRLICHPTAAIWFPLLKLRYVNSIMKMIYIWDKTRRKVSEVLRRGEMCVGWWISPVKKWLYAIRASARTFNDAYHFHNEKRMIKTEFARRAVITSVNSLILFCWSFWIAHRFSAVGSHHTLYYWSFGCRSSWWGLFTLFFWVFFGYRIRDEEMRWWHRSEARHAFLKRDAILLVI